ncbi:MAG: HNH endonuclease signature motif containing protein [Eubacteriales bacterium]|nr:HNH endonuclease signature motif containing protein [Eubacteriales bacterium]
MRYEKKVDPFYGAKAWRQIRKQAMLRDHGMCVECLREFAQCSRVRPRHATVVHHIIPRTERPDLALCLANLESLCDDHHAKKHPEKGEPIQKKKDKDAAPVGTIIVKI